MTDIRVLKPPVACCGVVRQGHEGKVQLKIYVHDYKDNILILEDGTLVWEKEVKEL